MDHIIVIFVFSCNFPKLVEECLVLLAHRAGKESRVPILLPHPSPSVANYCSKY